jgi:hypothetical protein
MDEMRMVRDLYEPPQAAPGTEVAAARARLDAAIRPRSSRLRWALPGFGLVAAVAGAVAVAVAVSGTSQRPVVGPPSGPSARTVLLDAALAADRQPAATGRYWHVDSSIRWIQKVKDGGYLISSTSRSEFWLPPDGSAHAVSRGQYLGARPATPADKTAWRKAGSPHRFLTVDGKRTTTSPEKLVVQHGADVLAGMGAATQAGLGRLRDLPTDPARLRTWLLTLPDSPIEARHKKAERLRNYEKKMRGVKGPVPRPSTPPPPTQAELNAWLFVQGADLILYAPTTAKARAAAFRMLAGLPGVKLIGTVRDADGRTGTAVAMTETDPGGKPERIQHRLVVDPAGGRALADEEVVTGPNIIYPYLPAGAIASSTTVRTAGWAAKAPS